MNQADVIGYIGAVFVFGTFWMKTMIPLRAFGLASNFLFIGYGYLAGAYPPLVLHILLLPLNIMRLHQMLQLSRQVAHAAAGDLNMDWIKPFTSSHAVKAGDLLFHKGEAADRMFFVVSAAAGWWKVVSTLRRARWSASSRCSRRTRPARRPCNASRAANCWKLPTARCASFISRTQNSAFTFWN